MSTVALKFAGLRCQQGYLLVLEQGKHFTVSPDAANRDSLKAASPHVSSLFQGGVKRQIKLREIHDQVSISLFLRLFVKRSAKFFAALEIASQTVSLSNGTGNTSNPPASRTPDHSSKLSVSV